MAEIIEIITNYDGYIDSNYTKNAGSQFLLIGYDPKWTRSNRTYIRFSLATLPAGAPVVSARLILENDSGGGAAHRTDIHAYNVNGQTNPAPDTGATLWQRCASGNLYVNDSPLLRITGERIIPLGGSILSDIAAAKIAVNRFSLALHEEGDDDNMAYVFAMEDTREYYHPVLEITYLEAPPPAEGYSYSDGLVTVQVAG